MSEWFLRVRRYVEATGCRWFIHPPSMASWRRSKCGPYEQTLNTMGIAARRAWARGVQVEIDHQIPNAKHVVVFAGQRYREF